MAKAQVQAKRIRGLLKLDEDLVVNMDQVTHIQWWQSGGASLWLGHTIKVDEGTVEASTMTDFIDLEPDTASVLRAYLGAHAPCIWCWAEEHLMTEDGKGNDGGKGLGLVPALVAGSDVEP